MAGGEGVGPATPEGPTEELPIAGSGPALSSHAAADRRDFIKLAAAIHAHERAGRSRAVAVTAADRRLYERLALLEQPD